MLRIVNVSNKIKRNLETNGNVSFLGDKFLINVLINIYSFGHFFIFKTMSSNE